MATRIIAHDCAVPFGFGDHDLRDCPPLVFAHDYEVGMAVLWWGQTAIIAQDVMPIYGDPRICIELETVDGLYYRRVWAHELTPLREYAIEDDHAWIAQGGN